MVSGRGYGDVQELLEDLSHIESTRKQREVEDVHGIRLLRFVGSKIEEDEDDFVVVK